MAANTNQSYNDIYPWQRSQWAMLASRARDGSLPHALLLTGAEGMGKHQFAWRLAKAVLCEAPGATGQGCGGCRSCTLFEAGSHPDFSNIVPEEEGKAIRIDQIRNLQEFVGLTSQYGHHKVVIISPAEQMNAHAAASLLKTLEEPAPGSILILVTERPGALPATIRSRCQQVAFPTPALHVATDWLNGQPVGEEDPTLLLEVAGGAPLAALALSGSDRMSQRREMLDDLEGLLTGRLEPIHVADSWLKRSSTWSISVLTGYVMDLIRLKSAPEHPRLSHRDAREHLQLVAQRLDLGELFAFLDQLTEAARLSATQVNEQLLLEQLLIQWTELGARRIAATH